MSNGFISDATDQVKYKFQSCAGSFLPTAAGRREIDAVLARTVVRALKKHGKKIWTTDGQKHVEHVACRIARKAREHAKSRGATTLGAPDIRRAANEIIPHAAKTLDRLAKITKNKREANKIHTMRIFC